MKELFADLPEAIENTMEIANKCEKYTLASDILLPAFDIPEEFQDPKDLEDGGKRGENNYLRHLTYEGADRKSTRLNSSHVRISYAVFCLKKKMAGVLLIVRRQRPIPTCHPSPRPGNRARRRKTCPIHLLHLTVLSCPPASRYPCGTFSCR